MRRGCGWIACGIAAAVCGSTAAWADEEKPVDYQAIADKALWSFFADRANAKYSAGQIAKPYRVRTTGKDGRDTLNIVISRGEDDLYAWTGHSETVFAIADDVLYYSEHHPIATGCSVTAYDLKAGKQLWQTHLKGMGPIAHTKYRNRVNLAADAKAVRIFGLESAGGYVEFVDRATGKTVGHRVFKEEERKAEE